MCQMTIVVVVAHVRSLHEIFRGVDTTVGKCHQCAEIFFVSRESKTRRLHVKQNMCQMKIIIVATRVYSLDDVGTTIGKCHQCCVEILFVSRGSKTHVGYVWNKTCVK